MTTNTILEPLASIEPAMTFPASGEEARRRVQLIDAKAYARTRNHLAGAVTRLSPYLTHGVLSVPEVIQDLTERGVSLQSKIVFELAWREYWHHVWERIGEDIFEPIRTPKSAAKYSRAIPDDVLEARTGVPAVDAAVRSLYQTGYIHNHARMWIASYLVHLRKTHWRTGADWFYSYLLDGDLASNTLSWQWVAGTFSNKPYLFNNDNVACYAQAFSKTGTSIDRSYASLAEISVSSQSIGPEPDAPAVGTSPAPLTTEFERRPATIPDCRSKTVTLVHPWMLSGRPNCDIAIGIIDTTFHRRFTWSKQRWAFVHRLLTDCSDLIYVGDLPTLAPAIADAKSVSSVKTLNPIYAAELSKLCTHLVPAPRYFPNPPRQQRSFSAFWNHFSA